MKERGKASGTMPIFLLAAVWALGLSGCSITQIQHNGLEPAAQVQTGSVAVDTRATGLTGQRVGWGRVTLFAIPVAPVHIKGDAAGDLMQVVHDALTTAGYTTREAGVDEPGPTLKANVDHVRFNNYTWLIPLLPTWGRIEVSLRLESPNGEVLWESIVEGSGKSFNLTEGFDVSANKSVTRLANAMVVAFGTEDFRSATNNGEM